MRREERVDALGPEVAAPEAPAIEGVDLRVRVQIADALQSNGGPGSRAPCPPSVAARVPKPLSPARAKA